MLLIFSLFLVFVLFCHPTLQTITQPQRIQLAKKLIGFEYPTLTPTSNLGTSLVYWNSTSRLLQNRGTTFNCQVAIIGTFNR